MPQQGIPIPTFGILTMGGLKVSRCVCAHIGSLSKDSIGIGTNGTTVVVMHSTASVAVATSWVVFFFFVFRAAVCTDLYEHHYMIPFTFSNVK